MRDSAIVRRPLLILTFAFLVAGALAPDLGCGSNFSGTGAAGRGGSGSGSGGSGGAGGAGGSAGSGGSGGDGGAAGTGGCAAGAGGALAPEQTDEALLNAPTTGGILVTRAQPPSDYPACQ